MKTLSKVLALILALSLVLGMSAAVWAAGTNSITVDGAKEGETYKIYKMLGLTVHENPSSTGPLDAYDGFRYIIEEGSWKDFWVTGAGADYIETNTAGDKTYVVWKTGKNTAADMEEFGKAAAAYAESESISPLDSKTVDSSSDPAVTASFTGLENGYYLITTSYGTAVIVASTPNNADQQIQEKNNANSVDKKVQENAERNGTTAAWNGSNDAQIGDIITFRAKVSIAKNTVALVYHDTMSAGLSWSGLSETKVYTDENCTTELDVSAYDVKAGTAPETFTLEFKQAYLDGLTTGTTDVYVKYTATLNDAANAATPETNTGSVTWGDNGESTSVVTSTSTHQFQILKYDGTDTEKKPLAGAKFVLHTSETGTDDVVQLAKSSDGKTYRVYKTASDLPSGYTAVTDNAIITRADGNITIEGVDSDDYYLEETEAPKGYNPMTSRIKVQVNADNNLVAEVENLSGTELPSTGGIGTTIFYVAGAVLVIVAGILLVSRKKADKGE